MHTIINQPGGSVLASLRALVPNYPITLDEALRLAERQATRLLELCGGATVPVSTRIVSNQPRITVEPDPELPAHAASGCSDWDSHRRTWIISLNPTESRRRQRFTVLHEYKHILDHPRSRYPAQPAGLPTARRRDRRRLLRRLRPHPQTPACHCLLRRHPKPA